MKGNYTQYGELNSYQALLPLRETEKGIKIIKDYFEHELAKELHLERISAPHTIGGGIGESRLCMFYLRKGHVGEVQVSVWPEQLLSECKGKGIQLL